MELPGFGDIGERVKKFGDSLSDWIERDDYRGNRMVRSLRALELYARSSSEVEYEYVTQTANAAATPTNPCTQDMILEFPKCPQGTVWIYNLVSLKAFVSFLCTDDAADYDFQGSSVSLWLDDRELIEVFPGLILGNNMWVKGATDQSDLLQLGIAGSFPFTNFIVVTEDRQLTIRFNGYGTFQNDESFGPWLTVGDDGPAFEGDWAVTGDSLLQIRISTWGRVEMQLTGTGTLEGTEDTIVFEWPNATWYPAEASVCGGDINLETDGDVIGGSATISPFPPCEFLTDSFGPDYTYQDISAQAFAQLREYKANTIKLARDFGDAEPEISRETTSVSELNFGGQTIPEGADKPGS